MRFQPAIINHCLSLAAALVIELFASGGGLSSRPVKRWHDNNSRCTVRITEYAIPSFPRGRYSHVIEASRIGSREWKQIASSDSDVSIDVPPEHIHFISRLVGYVYLANKLAITVNGCDTWNTKEFTEGRIQRVEIKEDGRGTLSVVRDTPDGSQLAVEYDTLSNGQFWFQVVEKK